MDTFRITLLIPPSPTKYKSDLPSYKKKENYNKVNFYAIKNQRAQVSWIRVGIEILHFIKTSYLTVEVHKILVMIFGLTVVQQFKKQPVYGNFGLPSAI